MIYSGDSEPNQTAFKARAARGRLRRLHRNLYTDEFDRPAEDIVVENLLAIVAIFLPEWQLSHSSAATRRPSEGLLFTSGPGRASSLELPGVRIIRFEETAAPEHELILTSTEVVRGVDRSPEALELRVSTPLQTIFECLSTARRYPQKKLPDSVLAELIGRLPDADNARAERFAVRNDLWREYRKFLELRHESDIAARLPIVQPEGADIYFYGWRVGRLTYLGAGEYRFEYDADWRAPLSQELPIEEDSASYEGNRMPAFFENFLPEGWTEEVVLASNKLSRDDLFGLFSTTRKYLSNMTLRPLGIPDAELVYDAHSLRVESLERDARGVLHLREEIGVEPANVELWRRKRVDGPVRLSGIQAKLPVSLMSAATGVTVRVGELRNPCTHILKIPSHAFPELIENEWATMELARRIGLPVAVAALVEFQEGSHYQGRSLLVERYDIPDQEVLDHDTGAMLYLQQDACSLLLLRREDKYSTSMERIADALTGAGMDAEGMPRFLQLVIYSWIIGNGDLHAKNVSVLHRFRRGRPGEPPVAEGVELAPFYDLVNTRLHLPGDEFAIPVDGKRNNLRLSSFARLASRWGMSRDGVRNELERIVEGVGSHLDGVLQASLLSEDAKERYRGVARENVAGLR